MITEGLRKTHAAAQYGGLRRTSSPLDNVPVVQPTRSDLWKACKLHENTWEESDFPVLLGAFRTKISVGALFAIPSA